MGGLVVGAALGGAIAQVFGVTGPFWFAFVGSAAILAVIWRRLNLIVRAP
jgi:H+/Cl- antiporter ClcA